uniref:Coiled-coil domain-containing protein n=1 Tax=Anopheles albimanus TaxID=7167 RepID=A0A182FS20_ANOAL
MRYDKAREHGVGYYAFSTDQEERARQREELDSIRDATVEAQRERERLRIARDKMIADRVKAAKARQRARQGLPPEEEDNDEDKRRKESGEQLYDTSEEQRIRKAEEKLRKKKEKEERKRERERAQHVRPWDEGKEQSLEDKEWVPAKERFILSQHEWNDLKRSERIAEFAPPVERPSNSSNNRLPREPPYRSQPNRSSPSRGASEPTESDSSAEEDAPIVGPMPPPPPPVFEDIPLPEEEPNSRSLFFTTKKNPAKRELKRRNLDVVVETEVPAKQQIPVPIRNELVEDGGDHYDGMDSVPEAFERARGRGAEIEPPPTYEYYGPPEGAGNRSGYLGRAATSAGANLEASIEAGLKFLRNQSDKAGGPGTKNRWSSNADY